MKKILSAMLAALLMTAGAALAEPVIEIEGTIEPAREVLVLAPHSGRVETAEMTAGDVFAAGDALLTLSTTKVYAEFDGKVTGVFAKPGDSAASVQARYGALLYMERPELYTASCTTTGSDGDNEDKIVHAGETVYIRSTADNNREGVATVTNVTGREYTLLVTPVNDLHLNESVKVYRDSDYDGDSCIGTGKLSRIDPVAVNAEGHVLAVHAAHGQEVARGDVLLEMVPDALDGLAGGDGRVAMPQDGVLLSVSAVAGDQVAKDQVLAAYCPAGEVEFVCCVDEDDLSLLSVGDEMTVAPDALEGVQIRAIVEKIAGAANENGEFAVTLSLARTDGLRIGMGATASK